MKYFFVFLVVTLIWACKTETVPEEPSFVTAFEKAEGTETATYGETIAFYTRLAKEFPEINIQTIGMTDIGLPLHLVTYNADGEFNFQRVREDKTIILINNGIHPGESDGIDATMLLYRDLALEKLAAPENVVVVTIPIYNVGGALNRNRTTRVNQNGPKEYGFRGNTQNYDLNRDFIKADTKNAVTFAEIFHLVKPDLFVDNHVSNGADYQYTLTHLLTQHEKLGSKAGEFLFSRLQPALEDSLAKKQWPITPYVNVFNSPPESGFSQFMDWPRYSTGYTTLWNTIGLMVETHMLKPYKQRVEGTYELMATLMQIAERESDTLRNIRKESFEDWANRSTYHLNWQIDSTKTTTLNFRGFTADTLVSEITGLNRLKYDQNAPFTKEVTYYNHFSPSDTIAIPAAYVIKQGWHRVIERLGQNEIDFFELEQDTLLQVESYQIDDFSTVNAAYEGHYVHFDTKVETRIEKVRFLAGDVVVPTDQPGLRYLLETLEPAAHDSFFNWNFFDPILQQKEGFSPYVFEDLALDILRKDQKLREAFLAKKENDSIFSKNWYSQLDWIYQHSKYREEAYLQYPVYRILKKSDAAEFLNDY